MTQNDVTELRERLIAVRELICQEGDKAGRSFTNVWLMTVGTESEERGEYYHQMSLEATRLRQLWTRMLDGCIDAMAEQAQEREPV